MNHRQSIFEEVIEFPDTEALARYDALVGLDEAKERLVKEAMLLVSPESLDQWSKKFYQRELKVLRHFRQRPPLFLFAGDVGTGKTALAKSFGAEVARKLKISIELYPLSLQTRGRGAVGEMTHLISSAFDEFVQKAKAARGRNKGFILLIDEADAIAQSREFAQMHHEDRAGVNAILRGIDDLAVQELSVLIVMCTNRDVAIDPAIQRRTAAKFVFERPSEEQRRFLLTSELEGMGFSPQQIEEWAKMTGGNPGLTYSDFTHRLFPSLVLSSFPHAAITVDLVTKVIANTKPTPRFEEG
jgi:AAA+ superfamily predicted ATPase